MAGGILTKDKQFLQKLINDVSGRKLFSRKIWQETFILIFFCYKL